MPLGWMFQPFQRQKPGQDSSRWRPHQAHWPADAFSLLNFKVLEFAPDAPTTGKDWNEALCKPQPEQAANESEPAYRCWLVWYRDRDPDSVTCCPPATNAEILAHHPGAVAAEPLATEP